MLWIQHIYLRVSFPQRLVKSNDPYVRGLPYSLLPGVGRHLEPKWCLSNIPDPCNTDPLRYAMLASIVEGLVAAFNWRLSNGQRKDGKHVRRLIENPFPSFDPEDVPL